ncbi:hypothetical protein A2614_00315 [Candidatus Woesebacteria bacterium RIFOXYD1_FULL_40_21]|uniref:Uncharacterized protein n=1 Tax=Candidatus Woesebacteria bacterium RIFOXYD1_FULL_40_21 TaxID=1802549 RepID=A0A1F8DGE5_9BACT|nr:MAG: hypothetical protein A2614_00315 [Candidatus Woesebacteria bacterium RIFOXYD1_FULL_40_21]
MGMLRKFIAILLSLLAFNYLFFKKGLKSSEFFIPFFGTVGFFLVVVCANIFLFLVLSRDVKEKKESLALKVSLMAIASIFLSLFRASFVDIAFLSFVGLGLTLITVYLLALGHEEFGSTIEAIVVPFKVLSGWTKSLWQTWTNFPAAIGKFVGSFFYKSANKVEGEKVNLYVVGILISAPVIVILVILLSSADPVFADLIKELFKFDFPKIPEWIVARVFLSSVFLFLSAPFAFLHIQDRFRTPFSKGELVGFSIPASILVSSVALVLGAFIVIQFQYLFTNVAETQLIKHGIRTYSEYVRKGFLELIFVSVIVYLISGLAMVTQRAREFSSNLKKLNILLLSETLIFIFSILRRVYLYQSFHGFTRVRIYGIAFLLFMIILTAILILRHFRSRFKDFYIYEIGSLILIVFSLGLVNVDGLIAVNTPPTVNEEVDYVYISSLSADASLGWIASYNHARGEINQLGPIAGNREFSDNEVRRLIYAKMEIENLISQYRFLAAKYGKEGDNAVRILGVSAWKVHFNEFNLKEKQVYDRLNSTLLIDPGELLRIKDESNRLDSLISSLRLNQVRRTLDRSRNYPLVPYVR